MFKDLKNGFQVCLLDESQKTPVYKIGNVVSVSAPRLDSRPMPPGQIPSPMMYSERVIDLTVECDGQTNTYVVQENANVASIASLTLACSVEPILNEVRAIHKTSTDIIASVDRHKEVVAKCEDILKELNPAYADSKAQNQRIDKIEAAISGVADSVRQIRAIPSVINDKNKKRVNYELGKNSEQGRAFMNEEYDQDDLERAYRRGCEHGEEKGYRKAMREMQGGMDGYGERGGYGGYGERGQSFMRGYGERDGEYGSDGDGERRGVKYTGRYSRYR